MGKYVERAVRVFLSTGTRFPRSIIWAVGMVKAAAARANMELGLLDRIRGEAIVRASLELAEGRFDERIVVDVFQTGSGTGLNMNANEVIAQRASELAGVSVHPNDHVNMSQSSNDVIPTVIRIAAYKEVSESLLPALNETVKALRDLEEKYSRLVKPGRTHLRDAMPVTLGQEMGAYRDSIERNSKFLEDSLRLLVEVPLGGTAVGTGINAHPDYPKLAVEKLSELTGIRLKPAASRFRAMRLLSDIMVVGGVLKALSADLWRLCQDLRLMYSGPFTGLAEIDIPQEIPGSSMMPGKVNPVTVEAAMQAASYVMGMDAALTQASLLGEFELSMGLPLAGYIVVREASILGEAYRKLSDQVLPRIVPLEDRMRILAERSQALITLVAPIVGYDKAAEISRMLYEGRSVREALKAAGLSDEAIEELLDLEKLVKPGIPSIGVGSRK